MLRQLYVQMILGIVAGTIVGHVWPAVGVGLGPLGIAFIKTMRMMVPPILFCTIVDGIVLHGGALRTGSTIARALIIFLAITIIALLAGTTVASLMRPGAGLSLPPVPVNLDLHRQLAAAPINGPGEFLLRMVPETFFSAFTAGDVLPVLFIAGLVGFGLVRIGPAGEPIAKGLRALTQLQFAIFGFLVRIAPVGAFGAIAYTVGTYGIGFIGSLGMLVATLALACLTVICVLLIVVRAVTGLSPLRLLRYFRDELLIVVGTSSSEVVLPRLMTKLETLGASPAVVGLVVPLGYTLNLAGTAIYLVVATLFLSEALDIAMPPDRLALYLIVMLATSKTAAGVTGSGFSALLLTLSLLPDIPVGAAAMLIAVDRILSTMRALTSGLANISASLLVARWDGAAIRLVRPQSTPPSAD
ncbi:dicarboxylate/amino acid:cation symporter [Sphingobium lactosutens]|uniref:cation:dicarboxylate symporter family transporter n=1 Tax=Sphingobium lactosutens TaxID=522773 RepID=UPI0015BA9DF3|nr:dicarboxylate/amino acid:cation symporter [Sphingobium lactosutens]